MREKVSLELKAEALRLLKTGLSVSSVSKQLKIPSGVLQTWSLIYAKEGIKGLAAYPKNICSGDIKAKILWSYREKRVPLHLLSAQYSVPYSSVCRCISTYRRQGKAGLDGVVIDIMEVMRSGDTLEEALSKAELKHKLKVAMNELEYLRAENALLKKVKALMEAEERKNKRSRRPSSH